MNEIVVDWTTCPDRGCRQPAEVQWRTASASTHGPIEHARVYCVNRHWFLLPVAMLPEAAPAPMVPSA